VGSLAYAITCAFIIALGKATRKAQRKAHDRGELLATMLGRIGDGVVTTDMRGHVMSLNPGAEALLG
jgi:PAS domain-containing protein